jgi:hypothetical protein
VGGIFEGLPTYAEIEQEGLPATPREVKQALMNATGGLLRAVCLYQKPPHIFLRKVFRYLEASLQLYPRIYDVDGKILFRAITRVWFSDGKRGVETSVRDERLMRQMHNILYFVLENVHLPEHIPPRLEMNLFNENECNDSDALDDLLDFARYQDPNQPKDGYKWPNISTSDMPKILIMLTCMMRDHKCSKQAVLNAERTCREIVRVTELMGIYNEKVIGRVFDARVVPNIAKGAITGYLESDNFHEGTREIWSAFLVNYNVV